MAHSHRTRCPECDRPIDVFDKSISKDVPGYITCPTCLTQFDPYTGAVYMRPHIPLGAVWLPRIIRIIKFLIWIYTAICILIGTITLALLLEGLIQGILP